jgi:hypothetical protein
MTAKLTESQKLAAELHFAKNAGFAPYMPINGYLVNGVSALGKPYTRCEWRVLLNRVSVAEAWKNFKRDIARWESAGKPIMSEWDNWEVFGFYETNDAGGQEYLEMLRDKGLS